MVQQQQLQIEFLPVVLGFAVGTAVFIARRVSVARAPRPERRAKLGKEFLDEDAEEAPVSAGAAVPEPAPEPEDEAATGEPAHGARLRPVKARAAALLGLAIALVLAGALLSTPGAAPELPQPSSAVGGLSAPASLGADRAADAGAKSEVAAQPTAALPPLPAAPELPAAAASEQPALAEVAAASSGEAEAAERHERRREQRQELATVLEPQGFELHAEQVAANKVVTVNLTRQQMAVRMIGGVVHYKSAYWGSIHVGTPAVDFKVVFDTGSGHLILPSAYCHSETCRAHKRYRRTKSSSAKDINFDGAVVNKGDPRDQITVSFGTGEVTGVFVEDKFCLDEREAHEGGQDSIWSGCVPMRMILATKMSEEPFKTFHFDGVLGLGLPGLSQAPEFNFAHMMATSLAKAGSLSPNMFAVFLAEHEGESSEITLGGYAQARMFGQLRWNPVLEPQHGHWMLAVKSVRIDDEVLRFCDEGCRAVVDTGTSLLAVPKPAFPEIFELLRHEADPLLECHGEGPKLHIELEDFTVTLQPHDYSRLESSLPSARQRQSQPLFPLTGSSNASFAAPAQREMCKPMLMSMSLGPPVGPKVFVLGEPVLRKYYTVYDTREPNPRIGFAPAVHNLPAGAESAAQ